MNSTILLFTSFVLPPAYVQQVAPSRTSALVDPPVLSTVAFASAVARLQSPVWVSWSYTIGASAALNSGSTPTGTVIVIGMDLYDVTKATLTRLNGAGKYVICYYSAGTSNNYRTDTERQQQLAPNLNLGEVQTGSGSVCKGERWLDIRGFAAETGQTVQTLKLVMTTRLTLARDKGCTAVEPDNVDAWDNLVNQNAPAGKATMHSLGLSVQLKNDLRQAVALVPSHDGALSEECGDFSTSYTLLTPFRDAGKAIDVVEYQSAGFANAARTATAANLHLNVVLTDLNVTCLNPYAGFGSWPFNLAGVS